MDNNEQNFINIVNATENNLKHVSLKIPKKKITVFTGVSGSGKSSLCLDTIAESWTACQCDQQFQATFAVPDTMEHLFKVFCFQKICKVNAVPVSFRQYFFWEKCICDGGEHQTVHLTEWAFIKGI